MIPLKQTMEITNGYFRGILCAHGVSYHQTYTWVKKYLTEGETGLSDRRGHHKADDEVDETIRWMCRQLGVSKAAYDSRSQ